MVVNHYWPVFSPRYRKRSAFHPPEMPSVMRRQFIPLLASRAEATYSYNQGGFSVEAMENWWKLGCTYQKYGNMWQNGGLTMCKPMNIWWFELNHQKWINPKDETLQQLIVGISTCAKLKNLFGVSEEPLLVWHIHYLFPNHPFWSGQKKGKPGKPGWWFQRSWKTYIISDHHFRRSLSSDL